MAMIFLFFFAFSIFILNLNFSSASSECDDYLICQNFETDPMEGPRGVFSLDNHEVWSWSCDSRSILNDTSWPLRGNSSLKCYASGLFGCAVYSPIINQPKGLSDMWVHFRACFAGPTADWAIALKNSIGNNHVLVRPYQGFHSYNPIYLAINDNATHNFNPGIVFDEIEFQLNTTYHFWIKVKSATSTTSNDGEAHVYISENGIRPSIPTASVTSIVSSADGLLEYGQVAFGSAYGFAPDLVAGIYYYDQIYVSATEIEDLDGFCNDSDGDGYDFCATNGYTPCTGGEIVDCDDNCPGISNPEQADTDGDGLGNACDNCPHDHNLNQEDADADGRGDACDICTDTDNDGYGNSGYPANTCPADNCPDDPAKSECGICGCGTSDADSDADALADCNDNCPHRSNGPGIGMCVKIFGGVPLGTGVVCYGLDDCNENAFCDMAQGDSNSNGTGDVCECYANISGPTGTPDSKVDAFDSLKMKQALLCSTGCTPESCPADMNADGKVDSFDLLIMKVQFNRTACPVP